MLNRNKKLKYCLISVISKTVILKRKHQLIGSGQQKGDFETSRFRTVFLK